MTSSWICHRCVDFLEGLAPKYIYLSSVAQIINPERQRCPVSDVMSDNNDILERILLRIKYLRKIVVRAG